MPKKKEVGLENTANKNQNGKNIWMLTEWHKAKKKKKKNQTST